MRRMLVAGRYRLLREIGAGGMGRVWLADDELLHREVAVKQILPPAWLIDSEREELGARTMREARTAARLTHPNVVRTYDVLHAHGSAWIVMEYVPSRSLQEVIDVDGGLPPRRAAQVAIAVLAALRAAHRAGILHRDVKPHNILLADDGRVMLTDFGLATFAGDNGLTRPGMLLGSPQYVAPERVADGVSTEETDLWSLGASIYAATEGRAPYARTDPMATLAALATEPPAPPVRAGALTPLLTGLLTRQPRHRLTAAQAERLLRQILGPAGDGGPDPTDDPDEAPTVPLSAQGSSLGSVPVGDGVDRGGPGPDPAGVAPSDGQAAARIGPGSAASEHRPPAAGAGAGSATPDDQAARRPGGDGERPGAVTRPGGDESGPGERDGSVGQHRRPGKGPRRTARADGGPRRTARAGWWRGPTNPGRQRLVAAGAALLLVLTTLSVTLLVQRGRSGPADGWPTGAQPGTDAASSAAAPFPAEDGRQGSGGYPQPPGHPPGPGGPPPVGPPPFDCRVPPPPHQRVPASPPPAGRAALPDGWAWHTDPAGFRVGVPVGWEYFTHDGRVCFHEPFGHRVLVVDPASRPVEDPQEGWRGRDRQLSAEPRVIEHQRLITRRLAGRRGVEWEYRWTAPDGNRLHSAELVIGVSDERAYTVVWHTSEIDWQQNLGHLALIRDSFEPTG